MTPERWQHIARIYELAADQDPARRDAFLSQVCAGDTALRHEVESLLRQEAAQVIVDRPVWATAARLFDDGPDLQPGATLGPYRIEGFLGAGGMGKVFKGIDTRLDRRVAIKVIPSGVALDEQMRVRFAREARAVAALTHPHICTLYDVGRHDQVEFLVMEYLEGDTLATRLANGQLPLPLAFTHAMEIVSALAHAHRHGIIHRDLKPANIMLTASGAKLLDFGLAKFRQADGEDADVTRASTTARTAGHHVPGHSEDWHLTRGGAILGTVRYMAPEQIAGDEVDARCDLFSFGAVLYEMLTGKPAFNGDSATSVGVAIFESEPPPISSLQPQVPAALDDIVRRCLAKNPDERWQAADDVWRELKRVSERSNRAGPSKAWRWIAASLVVTCTALGAWLWTADFQRSSTTLPASPIRSIAVLPLEDLSGDAEQEYFADGMTDQLIADLATIGGLRVIARTSVMHYRNARKPVPTIARELEVDGIIEASFVRAGDRVRITAKLIRGVSGEVLWAQPFEGNQRDMVTLQREVARAISSNVDVTLTPQEEAYLSSARTIDPEVHRQVLLGRHHTGKATEEGLRKAVEYFDIAIARDVSNAMAHAGLAQAYIGLSGYYVHPREAMPKAKRAAETAIALDESLADAHAALGFVHLVYDWDGPAAERSLLRALELNRTLATARLHYAAFLTTQARYEEAVRELWRAVEFDPVSIRTNALATSLLLFTRHWDDAIELARRGLEFEPDNAFALAFQGVAYLHQGRFREAVSNLQRAEQLDQSPTILALEALVLAVAGQKDAAARLIKQVEDSTKTRYFCPYEIGAAYVGLGDMDVAYRWFRKGVVDRADCTAFLGVEPWIDPFRSDPRYAGLVREIGLSPNPR